MKANETPKKIYVHKSQYWGLMANEHNITKNSIEYTQTDTFIDKAVEWLKKNIEDYMYVLYDKDGRPTNNVRVATLCFEDFKNYMKDE